MARERSTQGLRETRERLSGKLEAWMAAGEQSRFALAYTRVRRRFSRHPVPGMPEMTGLDPFVLVSVGFHLLVALLIYLLAPRAVLLAQRPPISVRVLEAKAQAPAPSPEQKPVPQERKRKAQEKPYQRPQATAALPKPQPAPPKPVVKPIYTPKSIPPVAAAQPQTSKPIPKTLPKEAPTSLTSRDPSPDALLADKGLIPMPVKPFQAEAPPAGAPSETPRSLAAPLPTLPEAAQPKIAMLPDSSGVATSGPEPSVPTDLSEAVLEGFQQPTGPVVVPERFLKGGKPQTAAGAAVELIDTSDPDFTEYFELIKRRVYAAWRYPKGVRGVQKVSLRFHLDRAGASRGVQVVRSTNSQLNASAVEAMHRASPFPPIPEKFRALVGQPLTLIFTVTVQ